MQTAFSNIQMFRGVQRRLRRRRRVSRRPIRRDSDSLASGGGAGSSAVVKGDNPSVASSSPQRETVSERPLKRSASFFGPTTMKATKAMMARCHGDRSPSNTAQEPTRPATGHRSRIWSALATPLLSWRPPNRAGYGGQHEPEMNVDPVPRLTLRPGRPSLESWLGVPRMRETEQRRCLC